MNEKQLALLSESNRNIIDAGQTLETLEQFGPITPEVGQVINLLKTADRVLTLLRSPDKPRYADGLRSPATVK